ncbi:TIR domain-containing protein [Nocardia huaxiensis]|uniref:TIR domain-containing protein n=1 Tax=Nocardia huaxiensis TaxID=2755382 RepID=UPI001E55F1C4|nr:TIR domain-containing protein [Nocardia huaxiensis]UFS93474.1 TIR domain-containing protein [Nocardia huaxiensis]
MFVSHASGDAMLAAAVVRELEASGVSCWIAPRNIVAGTDYAESIIEAIEAASVMVIVISDHANRSRHVPREVERAIARDVSLVPFRIADISPSKSLEYFLASQHWLHALPPPVEAHISKLVDAVTALIALRRAVPAALPTVETIKARRRPVRVPVPVAVFTGRDTERALAATELARVPVVTLVGPPGAGKSELARRVAADLGSESVVYVDLSTVTVTSSLSAVITTATGLDPAWEWPDTLAALDDTGKTLLLDNAETALAVDANEFRLLVRDLVTKCRGVRVLATSRERLGLPGMEVLIRVGALPTEDADRLLSKLLAGNAVTVAAADQEEITRIRKLADGLPLALVISAAWLAEVSPAAFLRAWHQSREMLSALPGFDQPDRSSSVHVSVAVSVGAMSEQARRILRVLAILPAGATAETVEEIIGTPVLASTAALVRKSLVEQTGTRLRLLVPIREFILAHTDAETMTPLLGSAITMHLRLLRTLAGSAYRLDSMPFWVQHRETLGNVGALIDSGLDLSDTATDAVELAVAAGMAFRATGRIQEGVDFLNKAISQVPTDSETAGNLREELGNILRAGARLHDAASEYTAALNIWTTLGRQDREAVCRLRLGDILRLLGRYADAQATYTLGMRLHEASGDLLGRADSYECLGDVACMTGDFETALYRYTQAQDIFRAIPDGMVGMVNTSNSLGQTRLALADPVGARLDYDRALVISTRIGDLQGQANAQLGIAKTLLYEADQERARERIELAEQLYRQIDDRLGMANTAIAHGDLHQAVGDLAAADAAYEQAEVALTAMASPANRILTTLRRALGRQLAWDSPQVARIRDEFALLVNRRVDVEECRRWPLERKGSVFHGGLELST